MKKIMIGMVAVLAISFASFAQDMEQRAKQKAEAAAKQCLADKGDNGEYEFSSSAYASLICDYAHPSPNYFGYTVSVFAAPKCPANQPCPLIIMLVSTVYVDCQGNVYQVDCY